MPTELNLDLDGLEGISIEKTEETSYNPLKYVKSKIDDLRVSETGKAIDAFGVEVKNRSNQEEYSLDNTQGENFKIAKQNLANNFSAIGETFKVSLDNTKIIMAEQERIKSLSKEVFMDLNTSDRTELIQYLEADKEKKESFNPEIEQLATDKLSQIDPQQSELIKNYYTEQGEKGIARKIWENTSKSLINTQDSISKVEYKKAPVGIFEAIENSDDGFLDKLTQAGAVRIDNVLDNVYGNFETEVYMDTLGEMTKKTGEKFDRAVYGEGLSPLDRTAAFTMATIEFYGINQLSALFEEKNSGAITAVAGQGLDAVFTPMRESIKSSVHAVGGSEETGENLAGLMEVYMPGQKILSSTLETRAFQKSMVGKVESLKNDLLEISENPKLAEAYIEAKATQYSGVYHFKGVEKFDSMISELKEKGDIEGLNKITLDIKDYNLSEVKNIRGQVQNNIGIVFDNIADKMGARLAFMDSGKEVGQFDFSNLSFGKVPKDFHSQATIQKGLSDLASYWEKKGLSELNPKQVDYLIGESIDSVFNKDTLTNKQRNNLKYDLGAELIDRRQNVSNSVNTLFELGDIKDKAKKELSQANKDFKAGTISNSQLGVFKSRYNNTRDTVNNPKKLEELEYQRSVGNMEIFEEKSSYSYRWTPKGREFLENKRKKQTGFHMSKKVRDSLFEKIDLKNIEKKVNKTDIIFGDQKNLDIPKQEFKTTLEKNFSKSGITSNTFIQNKIEKLIKTTKFKELQQSIYLGEKVDSTYIESDKGGDPEVRHHGSTFPKGVKNKGYSKKDMVKVMDKLSKGDLNIPEASSKQRQIMETYLEILGSDLSDIYNSNLGDIGKGDKVSLERLKKMRELLKQSKQFGKAYYNEYKKVSGEISRVQKQLGDLKEKSSDVRDKLRQKLIDLKNTDKTRKRIIKSIQKDFDLTDAQWHKIKNDKSYIEMDNYSFKEYVLKLEEKAFQQAELNYVQLETEIRIQQNKFTNYKNLFKVYDLPGNFKDFSVENFSELNKVLDGFKMGDTFLSSTLMQRFDSIDSADIFTIREAVESMYKDLPGLDEFIIGQKLAGTKIYDGAIKEYGQKITELENDILNEPDLGAQEKIKNQIKQLEQDKSDLRKEADEFIKTEIADVSFKKDKSKTLIEKEVKELQGKLDDVRLKIKEDVTNKKLIAEKEKLKQQINDIKKSSREGVKEENFKDSKNKTVHEKVTEQKAIKGTESDLISYDTALANKNPLYGFMVKSYNQQMIRFSDKKMVIKDKLGELLKKSRQSHKRSITDKIIPTDNIVFQYLEANDQIKSDMIKEKKLTAEDLELANFVKETFNNFKTELMKRNAVEKFLDNYVTHIAQGSLEVFKNKGIKAAVKNLLKKDEYSIDFGIMGDTGTVLGFEKFFKYGLERKGGITPTKDLGKVVMAYTNTFYKKLALDETIPKTVLYRDLIADSTAIETVNKWINNKKGMTIAGNFQGKTMDQVISGLRKFVSIFDLGFNLVTAGASTGGVIGANFTLLGPTGHLKGLKRKGSKQGKKILKDYEAKVGRNDLYNFGKEILNAPDITPLEIPGQSAFVLLSQVMQSGVNTAFLSLLTEAEYKSGKVSDGRIADIKQQLGFVHAMPGTESVVGNTFFGKALMQYKSWAIPIMYNNGRLSKRIYSGESKLQGTLKEDMGMLSRGTLIPIMMYMYFSNMFGDDETYIEKRIKQELSSAVGAYKSDMWLGVPRSVGFVSNLLEGLGSFAGGSVGLTDDGYKTNTSSHNKGDSKGLAKVGRTLTPGALKQFDKFDEQFGDKKISDNKNKSSDLSDIDGIGELDLDGIGELDLDGLGDLDLDF